MTAVKPSFFDQDACLLAQQLLGKVIRRKYRGLWLSARIIETEAYYMEEKGSHASLGYTAKRKALFMPAGTIYMYYARGRDSFNISCKGRGNAVLIKSAFPLSKNTGIDRSADPAIRVMQKLNPAACGEIRPLQQLCKGQTLLCQSLDIRVKQWDQQQFDVNTLFIDDIGITPQAIIRTRRLGIPPGRDEHLPYRFIDYDYARYCTSNPLTRRRWMQDIDYKITAADELPEVCSD